MSLGTAMGWTVLGGVLTGISWVLQKQAAVHLPRIKAKFDREVTAAFLGSPRWVLGVVLLLLGFVLFQIALGATGEVSILQPMFATGSASLAILAVIFLNERFTTVEWIALAVLLVAISILGATAEKHAPHLDPRSLLVTLAVVTALGVVVYGARQALLRVLPMEVMFGACGGIFQGTGLLLVTVFSVLHQLTESAAPYLLVPVAASCFVASFVCLQRGVQVGRAMIVVTLNGVMTDSVAIVGGILLFKQHLPADPRMAALQIVAFVAIIVGSCALTRLNASAGGEPASAQVARS